MLACVNLWNLILLKSHGGCWWNREWITMWFLQIFFSLTLLGSIWCTLCFSFWRLTQKLWISNCHVYKHECFYICHNYIIFSYNWTLTFPFTISSEHNYILFKVLFVFSVLFEYFLITSLPNMLFAFRSNLWDTFSSLHKYFYFTVKGVCWKY